MNPHPAPQTRRSPPFRTALPGDASFPQGSRLEALAILSRAARFVLFLAVLSLTGSPCYAVPDLIVVGGLTVAPSPIAAGNTLTVSISIKNNGSPSAAASTTRLQINNVALTATIADQDYPTPSIAAGETITQNDQIFIPANTTPDAYNAYVVLDRYYTAGQTDNSNDYGASNPFTILAGPNPPTATTNAPTNVTSNSARMNGTVNPNGANTSVYFQYGTTTSYGSYVYLPSLGAGTSSVPVSGELTLLNPNSTYHYRVVAHNSGGYGVGADVSFTTEAARPTVLTQPATSVSATSAQLNGRVTSDGGLPVDERRFDWGTTPYGAWSAGNWTNQVTVSGNRFTFNLTGLTPNTIYFFRGWAHNSLGWTNGGILSFLVPGNLRVVSWEGATIPSGLSNVVSIAAGLSHALALRTDGSVVAWGNDWAGETMVPAGLSSVAQIAAGEVTSSALRSDGTVVVWGNGAGSVGSDIVAIASSGGWPGVLKSDGTVVGLPGVTNVISIAFG